MGKTIIEHACSQYVQWQNLFEMWMTYKLDKPIAMTVENRIPFFPFVFYARSDPYFQRAFGDLQHFVNFISNSEFWPYLFENLRPRKNLIYMDKFSDKSDASTGYDILNKFTLQIYSLMLPFGMKISLVLCFETLFTKLTLICIYLNMGSLNMSN